MFNAWPFAIKFTPHEPRIFVQMQLVSTVSLRGNYAYSRERLNIPNPRSDCSRKASQLPARSETNTLTLTLTPFSRPHRVGDGPSAAFPEPARPQAPTTRPISGRRIARASAGDQAEASSSAAISLNERVWPLGGQRYRLRAQLGEALTTAATGR
jgi:hypothetical protein